MSDVMDVIWVTDAYGNNILCRNLPSLSLSESLIGTLFRRAGEWMAQFGNKEIGPYDTFGKARIGLEMAWRLSK